MVGVCLICNVIFVNRLERLETLMNPLTKCPNGKQATNCSSWDKEIKNQKNAVLAKEPVLPLSS